MDSLDLDPRIPSPVEIAVSADGGAVTLRGTVERFSQRRAAVHDARNVDGVYEVDDQLKVNLEGADRREGDEIRGVALQALIWATEVPSAGVAFRAQDGWITLRGEGAYQL